MYARRRTLLLFGGRRLQNGFPVHVARPSADVTGEPLCRGDLFSRELANEHIGTCSPIALSKTSGRHISAHPLSIG